MAKRLQVVDCTVDFPDDDIWDGEELVRTNGLNTATAVAELLNEKGVPTEEPVERPVYGWILAPMWRGQEYWMQVTVLDPEEVHIMTKEVSAGLFSRLFGSRSDLLEFTELLHEMLASDGRFHNLRWYPWVRRDHRPGALSPSAPYPGPEEHQLD